MAHVIAICGAGGKTTACKKLAKAASKYRLKVCIVTTTNMWSDSDVNDNLYRIGDKCEAGKVYYAGHIDEAKEKLKPLAKDEYDRICEVFDAVIIEADGSRGNPLKIPYGLNGEKIEPVIPYNVDEIIVVVGMEAIGREIGCLCHRFDEFCDNDDFLIKNYIKHDTIVTEELLNGFVNHYYIEPIKDKFKNAKVYLLKNDYNDENIKKFDNKNFKLCLAICASGFSKRYGIENKLFEKIPVKCLSEYDEYDIHYKNNVNDKLYQIMNEIAIMAKKRVLDRINIEFDIAVVTQFDEIINDPLYKDRITYIKNDNAESGLSSSIKLAVSKYKDYNAIVFLNADMPLLKDYELANFIYNSILNNHKLASMFTDMPKNPAYFEKNYFDELLKIEGDKGPRHLLEKNIYELYRYYIPKNQLTELDTKEDLDIIRELVIDNFLS